MRRQEEDALMWVAAGILALLAVAGIVIAIVLFVKKKTLPAVLVLLAALVCGLLSAGIAALMILAMFAWH